MDDRVYVEVVACSRCVRHSKLNCSFIQLVPTAYEHDGLFSYEEICSFFCLFICFLLSRVLSGLVFSSRSGFCRSFSLYFNHSVEIFELNSKRKVICMYKKVCLYYSSWRFSSKQSVHGQVQKFWSSYLFQVDEKWMRWSLQHRWSLPLCKRNIRIAFWKLGFIWRHVGILFETQI